jgi:uncharacterized membrane protein YvbJ
MYCPECGTESSDNTNFCQQCGENLKQSSEFVTKTPKTGSNKGKVKCPVCHAHNPTGVSKCKYCGEWIDKSNAPYPHTLATVLGYIFAILGGWLGLVFGLYLLRQDNKKAKLHGKIILGILGLWVLILIALAMS